MARLLVSSAVLFFAFLIEAISAGVLDCSIGCRTSIGWVQFNTSSLDGQVQNTQCTNRFHVQSVYVCMRIHCSDGEIEAGLADYREECMKYYHVQPLPWSVIDDVADQDVQLWPHITRESLKDRIIRDSPVFVSDGLFRLAYRSSSAWSRSVVTRTNYGFVMFGFFAGVFLISMAARLVNCINNRRGLYIVTRSGKASSTWDRIHLTIKRYLTTPALFGHHVSQPIGWCTVPQRIQSLTIAAFVLVNIVLCSVNYDLFEGNLFWPETQTQFWRYFADRTGVIAIANLPLMFTFAMRNNVLDYLTGWNFVTNNMFHRWVARVATVEAVVHSIAYTIEAFLDGGKTQYIEQWAQRYWWMGAIATIAMCLICGFSIYPLRQCFYEVFLLIHIAFGILFLVGMWYHVAIFDGEYNSFIYPCIGVWILDRFLRCTRLAYLNDLSFPATGTYNHEADLIRIDIPTRPGFNFHAKPGTHYYIYGCDGLKFWESHPFTLSTWYSSTSSQGQQTLTFLVRPYDSFTGRLKTKLVEAQNRNVPSIDATSIPKTNLRLAVEGPYGEAHTLDRYNAILFVVGGTGVTVALSHIQALQEVMLKNANLPLHHIHLVWAVRDEALYSDVYHHELAAWLSSSPVANKARLHVDVYITRASNRNTANQNPRYPAKMGSNIKSEEDNVLTPLISKPSTENTPPPTSPTPIHTPKNNDDNNTLNKDEEDEPLVNHYHANQPVSSRVSLFHHQRPPISNLVLDAAETWCVRGGRLAVVCCGPAAMADDTRAAVVDVYARGYVGVELFSEAFNW